MKKIFTFAAMIFAAMSMSAQESITCAQAKDLMPAQSGAENEAVYAVTGYVTYTSGIISKGQQTFWMDDAKGTKKTVQGYWCNLPASEVSANTPLNVGDKITLTGKILNYNNTPEIKNGDVVVLERVDVKIDTIDASVCDALEEGKSLNSGDYSDEVFRVYGRVKGQDQVNAIGQHTFEMACGEDIFIPYNCNGADGLELGKGDSVVVIGKLYNYNGTTIEIWNGKVELIEKSQDEGLIIPVNVAQAVDLALALPNGGSSDDLYEVIGYVDSIAIEYNAQYGNISFFMTDDMANPTYNFLAYRVKCSADEAALITIGSLVTVTAALQHYYKAEDVENQLPEINLAETVANGTALIVRVVCDPIQGTVNLRNVSNAVELFGVPNYGYHFTQWSDGNTDNPRTFVPTQDTTFTAKFAKNTYTIYTTSSANPEWGTTAGDTTALYLDEVEISAIANYGYHFVQWDDSVTDNPRTIELTQDTTFIAEFAPNPIITYIFDSEMGTIQGPKTTATGVAAENITFEAISKYGYHFVKWNDSVTDNPRTIWLSQDTTFIAEFAKNSYTISTISANPELGTTSGDTTALYLDEVEISAIPNYYGYRFVRWNDGNTSNPRTVTVTTYETYTATFAKDIFSITKNAEHGSISGNSSAEYLDFVTLTVTPDYGYHFTQWSDGLKDNPRIFQITKDTAFTAEFAYDRVGTCGKDLALVWSYDPTNKVLTIGNAGSFTENMQFGAEAPNEMEELVIGNSVTAIGANAFAGISTLKKVTIGESVKTIYDRAFYNCENLETIFNYRPTPTNAYSTAFDGVDKFECVLYVLPSSIDMYKNASVWRDFYYTYAIGAEEATVTTNDVQVEPQDNAATLTWPTNDNAASYTIQITKDGVVFCTLIFNANGQLIGIAFAPGRDGEAHAPAALMTANGLQFTVTGLDSGTQYGYSVTAKDSNDQPVATYSGEFTTTSEGVTTGVDNVPSDDVPCTKVIRNGQIYILRGEKVYTLQGQEVK